MAGIHVLGEAGIERTASPPEEARRLPRSLVPAALIGRLAVDRLRSGRGPGSALLADAFRRAAHAGDALPVRAVIIDAKDAQARAFYERLGFVRLPDAGRNLFHPVTSNGRLIRD